MNIIICLDSNNGMMFNHRRQSRDKAVISDIINNLNGNSLYIKPYSLPLLKQFYSELAESNGELASNIKLIGSNSKINKGDYIFIEDSGIAEYVSDAAAIIVYYWNREYPSDLYLDINLEEYSVVSTTDFIGNSHDKITKTIYTKKEK